MDNEPMLLDRLEKRITNSKSIISFETEGSGGWEVWDRYIAIKGQKAFHIGNICGTCAFFFERMEGANQSVSPQEVAEMLNQGVSSLDQELVDQISQIMPDGQYIVVLSECQPKLVSPGDEHDYFSKEQVDLWGVDGFWGMAHSPKTEYYRISSEKVGNESVLYEFLIPTFPHNWLEEERIREYSDALNNKERPTAITLSVLDVKEPADADDGLDIYTHWCLANYLIDGHHKSYAAAQKNKPITLISYVAVDQGISSLDQIEKIISR